MDNTKLSYDSEDDKCFGATGMAISVVLLDGSRLLSSISLDAAPDRMMEMADEFYFAGNPGLSAKSAWNQILHSFNLTMAMMIGNVMCRSMVRNHRLVDDETNRLLHDLILEEGRATCSLEEDECDRLYNKNYRFLYQVFNHRGVHAVAGDFADRLKRMRRMTRSEILEQLRGLNVI